MPVTLKFDHSMTKPMMPKNSLDKYQTFWNQIDHQLLDLL